MKTDNGWRRVFCYYVRPTKALCCRECVPLIIVAVVLIWLILYNSLAFISRNSPNRHSYERRRNFSLKVKQDKLHRTKGFTPPRTSTPMPSPEPTINMEGRSPTVIQPEEPCNPAETLRRRREGTDGRWFYFGIQPFIQFYAFSAIWDDRTPAQPVVRVLTISTASSAADMTIVTVPLEYHVYCRFHLPDGRWLKPVSALPNALPIGYGWWLNQRLVREMIYDCPPSLNELQPDGVTMLIGRTLDKKKIPLDDRDKRACVPVEYPDKPAVKGDFAACVQVTYGKLNPLQIIEWMELQRLLGVELVGIYNMSIEEGPGAQVLRYYTTHRGVSEDTGFVELRRSDYIADGPTQFLLHGSPVINDCMYRVMHRFRHIVVVDLDEFIAPQPPWLTLTDVIAQLERIYSDREYPPVNYIFANNYFFTDFVPSHTATTVRGSTRAGPTEFDQVASRLMTLRYRWRAPVSVHGYAVKSIIDPMACVRMHNHYCWAVTTAYESRGYIEVVTDKVAVNQHYKPCHFNASECSTAFKKSKIDSVTMARLRDRLVENVVEQIRAIFGISPSEFLRQYLSHDALRHIHGVS